MNNSSGLHYSAIPQFTTSIKWRSHPLLTAQTCLLMRHRDEMTLQQIAAKLGISCGSLQGGKKPTKWKALGRKFAQMAIDSVSE